MSKLVIWGNSCGLGFRFHWLRRDAIRSHSSSNCFPPPSDGIAFVMYGFCHQFFNKLHLKALSDNQWFPYSHFNSFLCFYCMLCYPQGARTWWGISLIMLIIIIMIMIITIMLIIIIVAKQLILVVIIVIPGLWAQACHNVLRSVFKTSNLLLRPRPWHFEIRDSTYCVTVSFHNSKSHNFKLSVWNPKIKYVAYLSVLSQISNCQGLGRENKHENLKTDRRASSACDVVLGCIIFLVRSVFKISSLFLRPRPWQFEIRDSTDT